MTYAEIDRMFFELLRLAVVAAGRLPDVNLFINPPDQNGYATAKEALRVTLTPKQLIEVYGIGSSDVRGEKFVSRFEVNRKTGSQGRIGGGGTTYTTVTGTDVNGNPTGYSKSAYPDKTRNILYDIRLITDNTYLERIMSEMIIDAFGELRGMQTIGPDGNLTNDWVTVEFMGCQEMNLKGYVEHAYRYEIKDAMIGTDKVIATNIVPLTTIDISLYLQNETNWASGENAFSSDFAPANFNNINPDLQIDLP